jgi:hypothetical protein
MLMEYILRIIHKFQRRNCLKFCDHDQMPFSFLMVGSSFIYIYIYLSCTNPLYLDQHTVLMEKTCFLFPLSVSPLIMLQFYMASLVIVIVPNFTIDQFVLHALKAQISYDQHNVLINNWSTSFSICNRVDITCGSSHNRVIALNLSYMDLIGTIPPHVGNLYSQRVVSSLPVATFILRMQ